MKKTIRSLLAAGALSAVSFTSAQAQSVDTLTSIPGVGDVIAILVAQGAAGGGDDAGLSLLDPNSIPVVGEIVGVVLDTGGVGGVSSLTALADPAAIPVLGTLIAGSESEGAGGLFGVIPVVGPALEPLGMPLFAALNPDGDSAGFGADFGDFSAEEGVALTVDLSALANDPANGILFGSAADTDIHSKTVGVALLDGALLDVSLLGDLAGAGLPVAAVPGLDALTGLAGAEGEGFQLTVDLLAAADDPTSLIGFGAAGTSDIHTKTVGLELLGPSLLDVALLGDVLAASPLGAGAGADSPLGALPLDALPLDALPLASIPVVGEILGGVMGQ